MRWGVIFILGAVIFLMSAYVWPRIGREQNREKAAYVILTGIGAILGIILVIYPNLISLSEIIEFIYGPLGKLLEK